MIHNDFKELGYFLDPNYFTDFLEESKNIPTVVHKYGQPFNIPDYTCWMRYNNSGISFTRNTNANLVFNNLLKKIYNNLQKIFPQNSPPSMERIHFIRTDGNVGVHKDEAKRKCCINIGLFNSSGAITRVSNDGIYENFDNNHSSFVLQNGYAYILNTIQWHSVEHINNTPRYIITYGFGESIELICKNFLRLK